MPMVADKLHGGRAPEEAAGAGCCLTSSPWGPILFENAKDSAREFGGFGDDGRCGYQQFQNLD
jgi:hypothetical protein